MENKKSTEAKGDTIMNKEDFAALWKSIRLKVTDTYDVPPEILWVNGSTIGTLGNFSASTGKAKSKKTFNISAIVAAALTNDEVLHYSACLPPDKRKILIPLPQGDGTHPAACRAADRPRQGRLCFHRTSGTDP